jgi:general secretion pathway protein E
MTFARGLRAILRQDPDVVMVGEIRDLETAEIAVQASLTGHLVLSTLHTNTAIGAVTRLQDMGIEPFLLSSSLIGGHGPAPGAGAVPDCAASRHASATSEAQLLGLAGRAAAADVLSARGLRALQPQRLPRAQCAIYELIEVDDELRA